MNNKRQFILFGILLSILGSFLVGCMGGEDTKPVPPDPGLKDQPQRPGEGMGSEIGKKGGG